MHFAELVIWASTCKTITLPAVVYGRDSWSLTLREHRLSGYEEMTGKKIFGPKKGEVTAGWGKFCNEFHYMYSYPNIIRVVKSRTMKSVGHLVRVGEKRNACRILRVKPE